VYIHGLSIDRSDDGTEHQASRGGQARARSPRAQAKSITEAIITALRERLQREQRRYRPSLEDEIMAISRRCAAIPRRSGRTPDEIIGYAEHGLPR
jgi:antitoxin VapB